LSEPIAEVGLYIHWPYCARICPYCDFNVVRDRGRGAGQAALFRAIVADLAAQAERLGPRRLASIFFGGGTPSLMDPDWAGDIVAAARGLFAAAPDLEVTLEANPTDAEAGRFAAFADAGVNRLSLGVQSLDDTALAFLGRNHDAAAARRAATVARRAFPRLSIDLIYALPGQTPKAWRAALRCALDLAAEHVSAYQLTLEPGTAFDRAVRRGRWAPPQNDAAGELFETTEAVLSAAGFEAYEVSNHARGKAARSRHNLIYWRGGDYLGVGPGAHGRITTPDSARWSTLTCSRVAEYVARVETSGCGVDAHTKLTPYEAALERLLMGVRTNEGVGLGELTALRLDPATIEQLRDGGLVEGGDRLIATRRGRAVLDRITLELAQSAASG
jgi:putative oxygen-independent coproporphyrinogen III oxidase